MELERQKEGNTTGRGLMSISSMAKAIELFGFGET
jgi:hypothetical protein